MLRQTRFFISAALAAVLVVSAFILSSPNRVEACPVESPASLLELFLRSDLIVVADVKSEKDGKIVVDEKDYFNVEVSRNLRVASVLKGKTAKSLVFVKTEYRDKNENNDVAAENEYYPFGYRGVSNITNGERYLFFFTKNGETARLELTDDFSGVKKLDDFQLGIHQKRLAELKKIVETKKQQRAALTDWLVRLIEEPTTRWDGVTDLTASFEAVEYRDDEENAEPFVIDKDFTAATPAIAENLSDSQKNYISSVYFSSLPNIFDKDDADEFYDNLSDLVSRWDKSRILTYAYGVLQNAAETDSAKAGRVMNYISAIVGDEALGEISSRYDETESENAAEQTGDQDSVANASGEAENQIKAAAETVEKFEAAQETESPENDKPKPERESATPEKSTSARKREKALKDFRNRYEYLLARNFAVEEEPAEIVQK